MRNRIMVIGRDATLRARLAQLASRAGCRVELAEGLAHARRAGLDDFALAIVVSDGLGGSLSAGVDEMRAAIGRVLVVASGGSLRAGSDVIDASDEAVILAGIAEACASQAEPEPPEQVVEFSGYRLDFAGHSLRNPAGQEISLTHREFRLLQAFVHRTGRVMSRDQLMQLIAGRDAESYERSIDMQIMRLRRKIEPDPKQPSLIVTVAGGGYKFVCKVTDATSESRKLVAILAADVAGFSRLVSIDEDRTLARLRALRSDLIDPTVAVHRGRVVKRTGDGAIIEFRSVVDAARCAIELQNGMVERNRGLPPEQRIEFRIGVHLGDVVAERDGDLMGDGVNIAARLEGVCEPGAVYLSSAAYEQVRDRLKETFVDLGETTLKNISRPVRIHALRIGVGVAPEIGPLSAVERRAPPRLSIVVLPFANISGDPNQDYFVDGVTESLTTDLSRIRSSIVIARNTAFAYKSKRQDVRAIGRELNVRYALEGGVQRGGDRMRVSVQLIDAETSAHLWAERFDKPFADLFDMQDEIVAHLARQLDAALMAAEARRASQSPGQDALDLYFQGMAFVHKGYARENLTQANAFFQRALTLDCDHVDALAGSAWVEMTLAGGYTTDDRAVRLSSARSALSRALSLAPDHALARLSMGRLEIYSRRAAAAIAECEGALALDRNLAAAHATIGLAKIFMGRSEETEAHVKQALRLSPRDPFAMSWIASVGLANLYLGGDEEAVGWLKRSIDMFRNAPNAYFYLAAALAHLGRRDEAEAAVASGLGVNPAYTITRFRESSFGDEPRFLRQRERVYDGLRMAGVPEG